MDTGWLLQQIEDLADPQGFYQRVSFAVLRKAIIDLSCADAGDGSAGPQCSAARMKVKARWRDSARYFFLSNHHVPWCEVLRLNPDVLRRVLIGAGLL